MGQKTSEIARKVYNMICSWQIKNILKSEKHLQISIKN
jgi:hypothetical protein